MDDIYAIGPASVVFDAVTRFAAAVQQMAGLVMQVGKLTCWSPEYELEHCPFRRQMGVTRGSLNLPRYPDLSGGPLPEERGYGVMVGGVPIGDAYYVHESLRSTAAGVVSYIETTVTG